MPAKPPSMLAAIITERCPQCRKGKVFKDKFYSPTKFIATYEHCPHCGYKFEAEPGFFWGAMYISYALITALLIGALIALFVLGPSKENLVKVSVGYIVVALLLFSLILRLSRMLMLHIFGPARFNPELYDGPQRPPEVTPIGR